MQTEWEATFWPIEKDEMRARLAAAGAKLVYPERLMRRVNLYPPGDPETAKGFARVRDEGDRITMTYKDMSGTKIEEQLEAEVVVDDFDQAQEVQAQSSFYSANDRRLHFGLGAETSVDLTIRWPNGVSETISKVGANQLVVIREGSGITRREKF